MKELKSIRDRIAELEEILSSDKKLKSVITAELREVQKAYGDDRRTQIVDKVDEIKLEDLIADTEMLITVSHAGYIKRTSTDTYRHQSRGGKGRIGAKTKEEDFVEHLFVASAHSYILLFTSKGRVYWLKVYELPEAAAATRGKAINSLVKLQEDEKLTALVAARDLEAADKFVFMATKNGTVKKSTLMEFSNPRSTGIIAINLDSNDELIGAKLTDGKQMIFLASHEGQAILFRETEVRAHGPQRRRRERHGPGQGRLRRVHGRGAAGLRNHRQGTQEDHAKSGRTRERRHQGFADDADADRGGKRLRQAHARWRNIASLHAAARAWST